MIHIYRIAGHSPKKFILKSLLYYSINICLRNGDLKHKYTDNNSEIKTKFQCRSIFPPSRQHTPVGTMQNETTKECSKLIAKAQVIVLNVVKVKINQFQVNVPFLHPLKTSENEFFLRFQGVQKWTLVWDRLKMTQTKTEEPISFLSSKLSRLIKSWLWSLHK